MQRLTNKKYMSFLNVGLGSSVKDLWRSRSRSFGCEFIDFDPTYRFPHGFPGFLLWSRVGSCFLFANPSL
jgi:hypothetical protein